MASIATPPLGSAERRWRPAFSNPRAELFPVDSTAVPELSAGADHAVARDDDMAVGQSHGVRRRGAVDLVDFSVMGRNVFLLLVAEMVPLRSFHIEFGARRRNKR